ncbi:MAG: energy-coupling factor transporter ATPase [Niameybacter sp.]|uniref:energy-coupling factor transporter ATPase n=1 Tax=Niameybacter sp. TaxID=2033640 RepID=UPI002FCAC4E8
MAIKIKDLTHKYNEGTPFEKVALKNINLHITDGTFLGIIGHTGSGKSTLIQMFNGLLKPTEGQVFVKGMDIHQNGTNKKQLRQSVGLVFQYPEYQLFEMTVYDDVAYGPKNLGLEGEALKARIEQSLQAVGLKEELWQKSPFELSGGQKRRVAIAGVLAMNPDILILDEPTAGLDPKGREELFGQLKQMHEESNLTIVLISHSMEDVARYAKELIVLYRGEVAFTGETREIFKHRNELEKIGLGVPQIRHIMDELKEKGMDIDNNVLTVEEAAQKLNQYLESGVR